MTSDRRGQGDQGDEDLDEALQPARQVGQCRRGNRREQGDSQDREGQVVAVDHDPGRPAAAVPDQQDEGPTHRRRAGRAQRDVARHRPAAREQGHPQHDDHDAERAGLVNHRHQPGDRPRRRMDDSGDGPVDAGVIADDEHAAHQGQDGTGQAHSVAPAPTSLAVAHRSQHDRAPATQERLFGACHGGGRPGPQARTGIRAHVSLPAAGPERRRRAGPTIRRGSGGGLRLPPCAPPS